MRLVKESSGDTQVALADMSNQAEFVLFSSHFFCTDYVPSSVCGLVGDAHDAFVM